MCLTLRLKKKQKPWIPTVANRQESDSVLFLLFSFHVKVLLIFTLI